MADPQTQIAIYKSEDGSNEVTVHVKDQNIWLTETEIAEVFKSDRSNVNRHINNVFDEGEVLKDSNVQKIHNGFTKRTKVYSLDVVISVGYRVNSKTATHFRQWATGHLKAITSKGYSLDTKSLSEDKKKLESLLEEIRKIRTSEANMYQKVRDVFRISSSDYDATSRAAKAFFAIAQDKFHYAVTEKTAAELVLERSDGNKENVGMLGFKGGSPQFQDVKTGKNYLDKEELRLLQNISEQFLLFAESKAFRGQTMTMEQISHKLNTLLEANDYPVLWEYDGYKRGQADAHAKNQLQRYRNRLKSGQKKKESEPMKIEKTFDEAMEIIAKAKPISPKKSS